MRYLFLFVVCVVIVVKVESHLQGARRTVPRPLFPVGSPFTDPVWPRASRTVPRPLVPVGSPLTDPVWTEASRMIPPPLVPVGSSFTDPVWTNPGMFRGGWNNMFLPQGGWNNFGHWPHDQWPHTWNSHNIWNTGIPTIGNTRNNFNNNNALASIDPWEQYRKFSSGLRSLMKGGISLNTMALQNPVPHGPVSSNFPWNTFAFNTNIPAVSNDINQGFVNPPIPPNINNQFQNRGFLSQTFPNSLPATNGVFV